MEPIRILPEVRDRLFPLRPEEVAALEQSVLREGIREPLVVWRRGGELIVVDGHHRYDLAKKHGLKFGVREVEFASLRRPWTGWTGTSWGAGTSPTPSSPWCWAGYTSGRRRRPPGSPTGALPKAVAAPGGGSNATDKKIASEFGVGEKTVRRAAACSWRSVTRTRYSV